MKNKKLTTNKALVALIGIILLLLSGSILYIFLAPSGAKSYTAYIYQEGTLIQTIDLSTVSESTQITVETSDGGYNIIEIKPGEIAVSDASCPDLVCMKQGFIHNSMLPITCLPNKLVIRLKENNAGITPDAITY